MLSSPIISKHIVFCPYCGEDIELKELKNQQVSCVECLCEFEAIVANSMTDSIKNDRPVVAAAIVEGGENEKSIME